MKTLLAPTTVFCTKLATAISSGGHYLRWLWSLRRLELSNPSSKGFHNIHHTKCWLKTSGKNKKIMWLNIVSSSLHGTALSEDQLCAIFISKMQGSWFADSICLYANRLNINTEGLKLSSVFLNTQKRSGKKTLFAMTYILFRYCFLFPSSYFHPKPQWILNHGPWMVVFIKVDQGSFLLLSLSRKAGNLEVLQKHTKAFILLGTLQVSPLPHSPYPINWKFHSSLYLSISWISLVFPIPNNTLGWTNTHKCLDYY